MVGCQFRLSSLASNISLSGNRGAVGAIAAHTDGILGFSEAGISLKARRFLERRFGEVPRARGRAGNWSVHFTRRPKFLPTSPKLQAGRRAPLSKEETEMRLCKLGGAAFIFAAVSRRDICAR